MTAAGWSTSKTLVDVVNDIFNAAANAVSKIKAGVTEVLNAVKTGMEWISDNVLLPIVEEFVNYISNLIIGMFEIIVSLSSDLSFSTSGNMLVLTHTSGRNLKVSIYEQDLDLILAINDYVLKIESTYLIPNIEYETLSVEDTIVSLNLAQGAILLSGSVLSFTSSIKPIMALMALAFISGIVYEYIEFGDHNYSDSYAKSMVAYHFISMIGFKANFIGVTELITGSLMAIEYSLFIDIFMLALLNSIFYPVIGLEPTRSTFSGLIIAIFYFILSYGIGSTGRLEAVARFYILGWVMSIYHFITAFIYSLFYPPIEVF